MKPVDDIEPVQPELSHKTPKFEERTTPVGQYSN